MIKLDITTPTPGMGKTMGNGKACDCRVCQQYFSIATLASRFEVSEKTIRRMITEGRIKAFRIGGTIRIPHAELAKIIQDY